MARYQHMQDEEFKEEDIEVMHLNSQINKLHQQLKSNSLNRACAVVPQILIFVVDVSHS